MQSFAGGLRRCSVIAAARVQAIVIPAPRGGPSRAGAARRPARAGRPPRTPERARTVHTPRCHRARDLDGHHGGPAALRRARRAHRRARRRAQHRPRGHDAEPAPSRALVVALSTGSTRARRRRGAGRSARCSAPASAFFVVASRRQSGGRRHGAQPARRRRSPASPIAPSSASPAPRSPSPGADAARIPLLRDLPVVGRRSSTRPLLGYAAFAARAAASPRRSRAPCRG